MPSARHQPSTSRSVRREAARSSVLGRLQALLVLGLAAVPLTASGHYVANRVVGGGESNELLSVVWLVVFSAIGLVLVTAGLSTLIPGWHKHGLVVVAPLLGGLVVATVDWMQLVDSWTGAAMNAAGLGVAVAAVMYVLSEQRRAVTRIGLRGGERVTEWFAGVLALAGPLALVLPHSTTIDGASNECSPMWVVAESRCLTPDTIWWPIPVALSMIGATMLVVLRRDT